MTLSLHPVSSRQIDSYIVNMPHALLITGPHGVGASTVAEHIAARLTKNILKILPEKDDKVDLESGTITVGLVRRLYEQTRTKTGRRVVIIDYAERMAPGAQNAFLKLLEEPEQHTSFILVSHDPQKLLPTIHSRVQQLELRPITSDATLALLESLGISDPTKRSQLIYMADGLPAKLIRLVKDQAYFEAQAQIVRDARTLLQAAPYDKLALAHIYKTKREETLVLIDIAIRMTRQALTPDSDLRALRQLDTLLAVYDSISANGNIRLQLARFAL